LTAPVRTTRRGLARAPLRFEAARAIECADRTPLLTAAGSVKQARPAVALSAKRARARAASSLLSWTTESQKDAAGLGTLLLGHQKELPT